MEEAQAGEEWAVGNTAGSTRMAGGSGGGEKHESSSNSKPEPCQGSVERVGVRRTVLHGRKEGLGLSRRRLQLGKPE